MKTKFEQFIEKLSILLKIKLPGADAHRKMETEYRHSHHQEWDSSRAKKSAVLLLLYPDANGESLTVLTLKQNNIGVHSGQISLPGGRYEEDDVTLENTALRESFEEIGVIPAKVNVIGELSPLMIPRSGFIIQPFVGYVLEKPDFIIQEDEVAKLYEVKLKDLFHIDNKSSFELNDEMGKNYKAPSYIVEGRHLWGATAMIMAEMEELLNQCGKDFI